MVRRLLDQNAAREGRRQVRLLDRIAAPFERRIRAEIARAMRDMIARFEATGETLPPRDHVENLTEIYRAMAIASVAAFGGRILDQGKASGLILERKDFAETMLRMALGYVADEMIRRRITSVAETTREQVTRAVRRGYEDGLGQIGVAAYIRDLVPSLSSTRANVIARTETHGAANFGSISAARETGLRLQKEWISAEDERTRESHADANGQIVGQDEAFDIGGEALQYPGDPAGSAETVINCRCTVGFVVED